MAAAASLVAAEVAGVLRPVEVPHPAVAQEQPRARRERSQQRLRPATCACLTLLVVVLSTHDSAAWLTLPTKGSGGHGSSRPGRGGGAAARLAAPRLPRLEVPSRLKLARRAAGSLEELQELMGKSKVDQLKYRLKKCGLPVSGRKAELIDRLCEYLEASDVRSWKIDQVKEWLGFLGLPNTGKKADLVGRLQGFVKEDAEEEEEEEEYDDDDEEEDEEEDSEDEYDEEEEDSDDEDEDEDEDEEEDEVEEGAWLRVGAKVDVSFDGEWFTCEVRRVNEEDETCDVWYVDDEELEEDVEFSRLRQLPRTWVKKGMRIEVDSEGTFYPCIVTEVSEDGKHCSVKYEDDDEVEEDVYIRGRARRYREPWIQKGARVEVVYEGIWYPGTVKAVSKDRKYCTVEYDDEEEEDEEDISVAERVRPPPLKLDTLVRGQKFRGRVKHIRDFGAFIDVGAERDGLVHRSKIALHEVDAVTSVVDVGEEVDCWVYGVYDNKLSLVLYEEFLDPTQRRNPANKAVLSFVKKMDPYEWLEGRVNSIQTYGAFIEVDVPEVNGKFQGLCHVTEISHDWVDSIDDFLEIGQPVKVQVKNVDMIAGKVGLTLRGNM